MEEEVGQLGLEGLGVLFAGEVAALSPPLGRGLHHPVDELFYRRLALRRAELTAEVLLCHHVGGELRPGLGHLDALLLEGHVRPGDDRIPLLPLDLVVGMHTLLL